MFLWTMKIVAATAFPELLARTLASHNDWLYFLSPEQHALDAQFVETHEIDLIVSFGYTRMIPAEVLAQVRAINLHGSLLPWNRGPHPNVWSWLHDTPKGVSIHELDNGIDAGPIIVSRELQMQASEETLNSSFRKLLIELSALLSAHWPAIRANDYAAQPQSGTGSLHYHKERSAIAEMMTAQANRPLIELVPEMLAQFELPQRLLELD